LAFNLHTSETASPEKSLISERVFLAFDTGVRLAYVETSGWERAYLLWTFRNFRGVPHKILNDRQRKLVETLYCSASLDAPSGLDEHTVIGTVEGFVAAFPPPASCCSTPEVRTSIPTEETANAGSGESLYARLAFSGLVRRAGAGALVAILSVMARQQLRTDPVVSAWAARSVAASRARGIEDRVAGEPIGDALPPPAAKQDPQPIPPDQMISASFVVAAPVAAMPTTEAVAPQSPNSVHESLSDIHQGNGRPASNPAPNRIASNTRHVMTSLMRTSDASEELARTQISGPPRKIVYPDCPDGSTRGKVSLQAVVGFDGSVRQIKVLTGNRLLAAAAAKAIREWRYLPSSGDAQKLERETRITVSFISNDVIAVSFPDDGSVSR
jgi:Gram-negative bacterial TonB protein C-terminal